MTEPVLYDDETGLPGRALIADRLAVALRGVERTHHGVALVLASIESIEAADGSAAATDTGTVLREVAGRLAAAVRGLDSVGRIGPTTFAIMFQGAVDDDALGVLAHRILFELSPPVVVEREQYFVLARLGGTTARLGLDDAEAMLERAGEALTAAREPASDLFVLRGPDD